MQKCLKIKEVEKKFGNYVFRNLVLKGGNTMLLGIGELNKLLNTQVSQKDEVNQYWKQFGTLESCLVQFKYKFYIYDESVIFLKDLPEILEFNLQGFLTDENFEIFKKQQEQNDLVKIQIRQSKGINKCRNCEGEYFESENREGACSFHRVETFTPTQISIFHSDLTYPVKSTKHVPHYLSLNQIQQQNHQTQNQNQKLQNQKENLKKQTQNQEEKDANDPIKIFYNQKQQQFNQQQIPRENKILVQNQKFIPGQTTTLHLYPELLKKNQQKIAK